MFPLSNFFPWNLLSPQIFLFPLLSLFPQLKNVLASPTIIPEKIRGKNISFHLLLKKNTQQKKSKKKQFRCANFPGWVGNPSPRGQAMPKKCESKASLSPGIGTVGTCTLNPSNMEPMLLISLKPNDVCTTTASTSFPYVHNIPLISFKGMFHHLRLPPNSC